LKRATLARTGVTRCSQYEDSRGLSTGMSTISGRLPRSRTIRWIIFP